MTIVPKVIKISIDLTPEEYQKLREDIDAVIKLAGEGPYNDVSKNDVLVNFPYLSQLLTVLDKNPFDLPF